MCIRDSSGIEVKIVDTDLQTFIRRAELARDRQDQRPERFAAGEKVDARVVQFDRKARRVTLSIKALGGDPFVEATSGVKRGDVVTVNVTAIEDGGIEVEYDGMKSFIRRSDLSRDRSEQRPERFTKGDKVDARITNIDKGSRRLGLSIKAREIAEEKEAVEQYGSSDSGASLGDILGAALKRRDNA